MLLFLIGYMGSGKSSLGPALAERLTIPFVDLDREIERKEGRSIPEIFEREGEAYFRNLETEILQSFNPDAAKVIATGGGAPCSGNNLSWMLENGIVFYLKAHPAILTERLLVANQAERPLLKDKEPEELLQFIEKHLETREPFYNKAHFIIDAESNLESIIEDVAKYAARFKKGF